MLCRGRSPEPKHPGKHSGWKNPCNRKKPWAGTGLQGETILPKVYVCGHIQYTVYTVSMPYGQNVLGFRRHLSSYRQHSPTNYKLFCYNMGKIKTDNLLRDNFEMFMASQLHNAFQVVVQCERHCWLSLAAGLFSSSHWVMLPERCASENIAGPCQ